MTQELIEAADELLTMLTRNEDTGWTARDKDVDRLELALELAKVEAPQATRTKPEPTKAAEQDYIEGWNDALSAFIAAFSKLAKRA